MNRQHPHPWGRDFNRLRPDDDAWRDYVARYAPTQAATLGTVARLTAGPVAQLLARHARAAVAAVRAYRSAVK